MSVKLSELLEAGAYALGDVARDAGNFADGDSWRKSRDTLRAITPALVEFLTATERSNKYRDDLMKHSPFFSREELTSKYDLANNARDSLLSVMKEAGVTCE